LGGGRPLARAIPALLLGAGLASGASAQGIVIPGAGPVNRSMGGAAVAAPLGVSGALHWNPASIAGLPGSEMEIGVELLYPRERVSSSLAADSLGPGVPPAALSGSDESDSGVFPIPTLAAVYRPEASRWSLGLGVFSIAGFAVDYPASASNPILTPQPPDGFGLGAVHAELQVFQVAPTLAYQLTDWLAIGAAPTLTAARLTVGPDVLAPPDDANGDGFASWPDANHARTHWGGGFQVGVYSELESGLRLGASLKSPQWFEEFHWNAEDELGQPRRLELDLGYPLIASLGAAFAGFERWLLALDLRYLDFAHTDPFRDAGFAPGGEVTGLGWDSVFALAAGVQYAWGERLSLRLGYSYNTSPIDGDVASFNVASPTVFEHILYAGASVHVTPTFLVSIGYAHAFENSVSGPIQSPLGAIPGSSVQSELEVDTWMLGASVRF
jgi:long-chain fatty acid transport protein